MDQNKQIDDTFIHIIDNENVEQFVGGINETIRFTDLNMEAPVTIPYVEIDDMDITEGIDCLNVGVGDEPSTSKLFMLNITTESNDEKPIQEIECTEHTKPQHKKNRSSCVLAFDASKKMLEDSAKKVYKFCCFVISTGQQLTNYERLPKWLQDNDFIRHFHRPQLESFKQCFKSVFSLHTETGNIWTHIIGVIIMIVFSFVILLRPKLSKDGYPHYPNGPYEYLFFSIFFLCACVCMTFSWLFHTMSCHSEKVHSIFAKMDYTGIALLITGSSIPVIYYGFYCSFKFFYIYLALILFLGCCSVFVSLWDIVSTPKFRPLRSAIFLTFGLSNIVPIIHVSISYGYKYSRDAIQVYYLGIMGSLYVSGALLYSFRVPERIFPGKITLIFQSHQIFHVLVVIAAVIHTFALCRMASYRVSINHVCKLK